VNWKHGEVNGKLRHNIELRNFYMSPSIVQTVKLVGYDQVVEREMHTKFLWETFLENITWKTENKMVRIVTESQGRQPLFLLRIELDTSRTKVDVSLLRLNSLAHQKIP
jgi:hypothetical protein